MHHSENSKGMNKMLKQIEAKSKFLRYQSVLMVRKEYKNFIILRIYFQKLIPKGI